MKAALAITAIGVVTMVSWLGCAKEQSRTAAGPPTPADTMGRAELQAPSPEDSEATDEPLPEASPAAPDDPPAADAQLGVRPDGTPVTAANIVLRVGSIPVPDDAALTASMAAVDGLFYRTYQTKLSYRAAVRFFDRTLEAGGFEASDRTATDAATVWSVRCPRGERAHVAVRNTTPTSIDVVEASEQKRPAP
jgi:hypothetical protein